MSSPSAKFELELSDNEQRVAASQRQALLQSDSHQPPSYSSAAAAAHPAHSDHSAEHSHGETDEEEDAGHAYDVHVEEGQPVPLVAWAAADDAEGQPAAGAAAAAVAANEHADDALLAVFPDPDAPAHPALVLPPAVKTIGLDFMCLQWLAVLPGFFIIVLATILIFVGDGKMEETLSNQTIDMKFQASLAQVQSLVSAPMFAAADLHTQLSMSFPGLEDGSASMESLRTQRGWLSSFSLVAARYPQLHSIWLTSATLDSSVSAAAADPSTPLYAYMVKASNGSTLDASGGVSISLISKIAPDGTWPIDVYTPRQSLHPSPFPPLTGPPAFFPADTRPSDSAAAIDGYLGAATRSGYWWNASSLASFAQRLDSANTSFGWWGGQQADVGATSFVATLLSAPSNQSSRRMIAFAGYRINDLSLSLQAMSVGHNGASFILRPDGWIVAASEPELNQKRVYDYFEDDWHTWGRRLSDFFEGSGFYSSAAQVAYRSEVVTAFIPGQKNSRGFDLRGSMIPGLPANAQLILVTSVTKSDLTPESIVGYTIASILLLVFGMVPLFGGIALAGLWWGPPVVVAQVVWEYLIYQSQDNARRLLQAVRYIRFRSTRQVPLTPRMAQLLADHLVPLEQEPVGAKGSMQNVLRTKPWIPRWQMRMQDVTYVTHILERFLLAFVETECDWHFPEAPPQQPPQPVQAPAPPQEVQVEGHVVDRRWSR